MPSTPSPLSPLSGIPASASLDRDLLTHLRSEQAPQNPQFDDGIIVWDDALTGRYAPADYGQEFEEEWHLFLAGQPGWVGHPGVEVTDEHVDARIRDLTGVSGVLASRISGLQPSLTRAMEVDPPFPMDWYSGKRCLDVGCGGGRWTRALLELGAQVTSLDATASAISSVRRFNADAHVASLFDLAEDPRWSEAYDFVLCWGVLMHTHDPAAAFRSVASCVAPGGALYVMVYAPEGMHGAPENVAKRKHYHRELATPEERLQYAYACAPDPSQALGWYDLLNPFYNWVVPEAVIRDWFLRAGFSDIRTLNTTRDRCANHVVGIRPF